MQQISTQAQNEIRDLQDRAEQAWGAADSMTNFAAGPRLRQQAEAAEARYLAACRQHLCCEATGCYNRTQFSDHCTNHQAGQGHHR